MTAQDTHKQALKNLENAGKTTQQAIDELGQFFPAYNIATGLAEIAQTYNTGNITLPDALAQGAVLVATSVAGKKVAGAVGITAGAAIFTQEQLGKKFKHAVDFGVNTTKKNPLTLAEFQNAITSHLNDAATVQKGTYGLVKDSKVFFNPNTNNVVVLDNAGNFVTGFKLDPGTPQFNNFITNGFLR